MAERPHPLDNAAWHALTGPHAPLAEGDGAARRYPADVSFFAAVDGLDAAGWDALAGLAGPGGVVVLSRVGLPGPADGWTEVQRVPSDQMILAGDLAPAGDGPGVAIRKLTAADVPAMLELTGLARPGPFFPGTFRLGGYAGVEEGGRLVAMAGRRLRLDGFAEVSAVCVHPDATGRGLGSAVTRHVARRILARGETPFLHVAHGNDRAKAVYERLGFTVRSPLDFGAFRLGRPPG